MKRVWKFATGVDIPEGAVYLSTITEDTWQEECVSHCNHGESNVPEKRRFIEKRLVWHYFLVDVPEAAAEKKCQECEGVPDREWCGMYFCEACWNKPPTEKTIGKDTEHSMHCCCPECISPPRK